MPSDAPAISVIIPTRDRLPLLTRALASAASQQGADMEVVVVDDGSSDATRAQTKALLDQHGAHFRLVELGAPGGAGHGPNRVRNAGVQAARAEILAFLDDDDEWIRADHLRVAGDAFAERPALDYYFANQETARGGDIVATDWLPDIVRAVAGQAPWRDDLYPLPRAQLMASGMFPHLNTTVVRRALFDRIGGFTPYLPYSGDLDLSRRLAAGAREMLFRNALVSRHHMPDRAAKANVSTRLDGLDKRLVLALIHLHAGTRAAEPGVEARSLRDLGDELRHLTFYADQQGSRRTQRGLARLALAAQPSLKWAVYTVALHLGVRLIRRDPIGPGDAKG